MAYMGELDYTYIESLEIYLGFFCSFDKCFNFLYYFPHNNIEKIVGKIKHVEKIKIEKLTNNTNLRARSIFEKKNSKKGGLISKRSKKNYSKLRNTYNTK